MAEADEMCAVPRMYIIRSFLFHTETPGSQTAAVDTKSAADATRGGKKLAPTAADATPAIHWRRDDVDGSLNFDADKRVVVVDFNDGSDTHALADGAWLANMIE